jgi:pimeloyl-ACP methyl ester carboxylesterase
VFLAGLSNGAAGAVTLAAKFASELEGMILISGTPASGGTSGLPTLIIHGDKDPMASASAARAFAQHPHATYAEFDGGHFVWLMRRPEIHTTMVTWLMRRAGYKIDAQ